MDRRAHLFCLWTFVLYLGMSSGDYTDPHCLNNTLTIVHMFEWKWTDIERECSFLAQAGYCGVQTSVPTEHMKADDWVWGDRYMPVSYKIQTRSGNEAQFASMVKTCNDLGVRIFVDVELNHMAAGSGVGTANSPFDSSTLSYPGVPYTADDFHIADDCTAPNKTLTMDSTGDQLRKCRIFDLPDLDQSKPNVRKAMSDLLNKFVDMGVAGFRVDIAQHMLPKDLKNIFDQVHDVQWGGRPFFINEVVNSLPFDIFADEYFELGYVTECIYAEKIGEALKTERDLSSLCGIFDTSLPANHALVFVDNFNFQKGRHRPGLTILTFKDQDLYAQAQAFTLATGFGIPRIMSSYSFSLINEGPPTDGDGNILDVVINDDGSCGNGWICEHRWPVIRSMVRFANIERGKSAPGCAADANEVFFSLGGHGFFWTSNDNRSFRQSTGLPQGIYCDQIEDCKTHLTINVTGHVQTTHSFGNIIALTKISDLPTETTPQPALESTEAEVTPTTKSAQPTPAPETTLKTTTTLAKTTPTEKTTVRETTPRATTTVEEITPTEKTTVTETTPRATTTVAETTPTEKTTVAETTPPEKTTVRETTPRATTTVIETTSTEAATASETTAITETTPGATTTVAATTPPETTAQESGTTTDKKTIPTTEQFQTTQKPTTKQPDPTTIQRTNRPETTTVRTTNRPETTRKSTTKRPRTTRKPTTKLPKTTKKPTPAPTRSPWSRTVIMLRKVTDVGEEVFFRGGSQGCRRNCEIPIRHRELDTKAATPARDKWAQGDTLLDWYGAQGGQGKWNGQRAGGSPGQWTSNSRYHDYHHKLNRHGDHYWLLDVDMDCSKTNNGYFEFKGYIITNSYQSWESDISYNSCIRGVTSDINHIGICGRINKFSWGSSRCSVTRFE